MPSSGFLDQAYLHYLTAIQDTWSSIILIHGVKILLMLVVVELGINWTYAIGQRDAGRLIDSTAYSLLSAGVLYTVFLHAQEWGDAVLQTFIDLGRAVSTLSPATMTPSGIVDLGLSTASIFWEACAHASWVWQTATAVTTLICTLVIAACFGIAGIIYLLALIEAQAVIIGGSLLLAFAALPYTAPIFPAWGLRVLSVSMKIFTLLAVLTIGLEEARLWSAAMEANKALISQNIGLMFQAILESILFVACVYYVPNALASLVVGGGAAVMNAGEGMLASAAGAAGSAAESAGGSAAKTGGQLAAAGAMAAGKAAAQGAKSAVRSMLLQT